MKAAPFRLTQDAEKMIRHMLASTKEEMEPALGWAPSLESFSKDGRYLGRYEGPMVAFGHWRKNERPRDSFYEVCGEAISILPDTLEQIAGRTISLEQVELLGGAEPSRAYVFKTEANQTLEPTAPSGRGSS